MLFLTLYCSVSIVEWRWLFVACQKKKKKKNKDNSKIQVSDI